MKKRENLYPLSGWYFKILYLMRNLCIFILVFNLGLSAKGHSQDQRVDIELENASIEDFVRAIKSQCEVGFLYDYSKTKSLAFTVKMKDALLADVLNRAFKDTGFSARVENDIIIIRERLQNDEVKSKTIKGVVTDEKNLALPGVTVSVVSGSRNALLGTVTNVNGEFSITLPDVKGIKIRFSFVGMETMEIEYKDQETINVKMQEDLTQLDEVTVSTGYLDIRKSSFTGNATIIEKDDILKTNNRNVIAALQTFEPSFRITENNEWGSDPNSLPEFTLRGESSIAMNKGIEADLDKQSQRTSITDNPNLPIFILDGFEVSVQKIYDMDINRIESMTILKDAAATAMYGSRAANGVIIVTSVAPKPGQLKVNYVMTGGIELPDLSDYNLANAKEMLEIERIAGVFADNYTGEKAYNEKYKNILKGIDTDWLAQPLRNAFNHKHSLYIEGGAPEIIYGFDLSYDSNKGAMKGSYRDRYGFGLTLQLRVKEKLNIRNSVSYTITKNENSPYGTFSDYTKLKPYYPIYNDDGSMSPTYSSGLTKNPMYSTLFESYSGRGYIYDLTNNFNFNWFIIDDLQLKGQLSITKNDSESESFIDPAGDTEGNRTDVDKQGVLDQYFSNGFRWNLNANIHFNKEINDHFINSTVGINVLESKNESRSMSFRGFQVGNMNSSAFASEQISKTSYSSDKSRLFGFLAALNYSYKNTYLLDASFRLDGSSKFGSDKRYAPFWSTGLGLNLHKYAFIEELGWLNEFKIRGSYGSTGKINFPSYTAISTYEIDTDSWYFTGPAAYLKYLGNPLLTWETTNTLDVGFNLELFDKYLKINASYYKKTTKDMIDEVNIRTSSGFKTYYINSGNVENKGYEVSLFTTLYRDRDLMLVFRGNMAANKNKITKLGPQAEEYNKQIDELVKAMESYHSNYHLPFTRYYKGASTTAIYAVKSLGIDPANGQELFLKRDGTSTYVWDVNDQFDAGDSSPKAQGSFGINIGYKGFFLNASFLYQWGAQSYNMTLINKVESVNIQNSNVDKRVLTDRWQKPGDIAQFRELSSNGITKTRPTTRFLQDYNYLNFNNLSLGYDFDNNLIRKWGLSSLGIKFNAIDIKKWSSVKEERGLSYPYARNYNFTLTTSF